ncbi:MAG: hypothetical protein OEN01_06345 [Candidatus Krumholzibacteria bacterium]|nr:hypothetical protein [Candidatus Krumholzibacteria bacterium]
MTNNERPDNGAETADVDPGEPIRELDGLEDSSSPRFLPRIMGAIDRRILSVELVDAVRDGFREMFKQYWTLVVSIFKDKGTGKQ